MNAGDGVELSSFRIVSTRDNSTPTPIELDADIADYVDSLKPWERIAVINYELGKVRVVQQMREGVSS
jgi:hypothetical protein